MLGRAAVAEIMLWELLLEELQEADLGGLAHVEFEGGGKRDVEPMAGEHERGDGLRREEARYLVKKLSGEGEKS